MLGSTLKNSRGPPAAQEELFEWVDLLESVESAGESFVFVELGAGYGRWSVRAFHAARRAGLKADAIKLVTVEPEKHHSEWLLKNMKINNIPPESHLHFDCAVSDWSGVGDFYVLQPGQTEREEQARRWYGQALRRPDNSWEGAGTEEASVLTLTQILAVLPSDQTIDLLDMDLQGEDGRVLHSSVDILSRVKKIHIGTDSLAEDATIAEIMHGMGWRLIRRYLPLRTTPTAYGPIRFVDGVMTWVNPALD